MTDIKRRGRPRGPQTIFNLMLSTGRYAAHYTPNISSGFMCNALREAMGDGLISNVECAAASVAISEYLKESPRYFDGTTLQAVLLDAGQPCDFEARAALYTNWAKRPSLA